MCLSQPLIDASNIIYSLRKNLIQLFNLKVGLLEQQLEEEEMSFCM